MKELKTLCDKKANFKKVIELIEEMKEKEKEIKEVKPESPIPINLYY